jgi:hypothetical protein
MFSVTVCAYNLAQAQGASTVFLLFFEHFFDRATWREKAGFARFFGGSKSVQDTNSSFCHFIITKCNCRPQRAAVFCVGAGFRRLPPLDKAIARPVWVVVELTRKCPADKQSGGVPI